MPPRGVIYVTQIVRPDRWHRVGNGHEESRQNARNRLFGHTGTVHPPIEPSESGLLPVADHNRIYWEATGNPRGEFRGLFSLP